MSPEIVSTYRVQLNRGFTFDDAAAIVPYLQELGISHLYCSPYLQARPGSTHGYDVVDHTRLNEELGGLGGHARLSEALSENGMGHVLDIVPNHMAITDRENVWWWDVLKNGPNSRFAKFFDIEWSPGEPKLRLKILMAVLGDHYGHVLERGELVVERDNDEAMVRYHESEFPLSSDTATLTDEEIDRVNSDPDALDELLEKQHYRLAFWRVAGRELNYRRFFAITDLAGLRIEDPEVFKEVHSLVFLLLRNEELDGLRIDHVDGLRFPQEYLERLRAEAPDAYIVVEKILEPGEELPASWPVDGTTGYDFLNRSGDLFVDPASEDAMTRTCNDFVGRKQNYSDLERTAKLDMMRSELSTDIDRLTDIFVTICELRRRYRDYTRQELREALMEVAAAFPVYRTYIDPRTKSISERDAQHIEFALRLAAERWPSIDDELYTFLGELLSLKHDGKPETDLAMRFQQLTGPVMAKGVEDTLFYLYNRLTSLNEVGGDPSRFGTTLDNFHEDMASAQARWPRSMVTTSTHDTKRSEDVRARISLLSEIPERWAEVVGSWQRMNARHRHGEWPDANAEYLLYQTLVGAWPLEIDRAARYMEKATKEAKEHTSWIAPNEPYDAALRQFVEALLTDDDFKWQLGEFAGPLVWPGRVNSLAQTLIRLTAPGIPDTYQGNELWDLSLVDPDNRRSIDFDLRRKLLAEIDSAGAALDRTDEGGPKLWVTRRALALRQELPSVFGRDGGYRPLFASGERRENVVAFARGASVAVVVPRLTMSFGNGWGDTTLELPDGPWIDELTGAQRAGVIPVGELWADFPVALLRESR